MGTTKIKWISEEEGASDKSTICVVDTNILLADPSLRGVAWTRLRLLGAFGPLSIVIPEVVVREVVRRRYKELKRSLSEAATKWGEALAAMSAANVDLPEGLPTVRDLRSSSKPTSDELAERLRADLAAMGATIRPIPASLDHDTLVNWSLWEHPPFDSTDKGYRDALIWATVREVAREAEPGSVIVFITNDNDCCDGKEAILHPKLIQDLTSVTANTVSIAKTIEDAIALTDMGGVLVELLEPPIDLPSRTEQIGASIDAACQNLVGSELFELAAHFDVTLDREIDEPTVLEVWPDLATLTLDIHEVFEGGTEIGEATVDAEIGYEATVLKEDCDRPNASWTVADEEYGDDTVLVNGEFEGEMRFSFVIDGGGVQAIELTSFVGRPR